jgi:starch synthase (maltosyl-transferring)
MGKSIDLPSEGRQRVIIENVTPELDRGRFPVKSSVGEDLEVQADIFADGHDTISAIIRYRHATQNTWQETPLTSSPNDHWKGTFRIAAAGEYRFTIMAWINPFRSWRRDLEKRSKAGQDLTVELELGSRLIKEALKSAKGSCSETLDAAATLLLPKDPTPQATKTATALDPQLADEVDRCGWRPHPAEYDREIRVVVDPPQARFSAWYELFPRSCSPVPGRHGTFADCATWLPRIASLGFDVVYLPPIHPIGHSFRKGKNNSMTPGPDEPGSPWAIGSEEGGHKSIHRQLGTLEDFHALLNEAKKVGIEIALDVAFQCSPDHPYVSDHPEWFYHRPDGSIQYAENPPKKYQDIYPLNFECAEWRSLWEELKSVFEFWMEQGVWIFRVDNPHTKSFRFWEWCLTELKKKDPRLILLSEAFTRPKVMRYLAKAGFNQSYNYFPWRNTKHEITTYLTELTRSESHFYLRPNLWPNTPDILPHYLQYGGRPAFVARLVLGATLGASYGVYGPPYEWCMGQAREPGSEEYLDSEKYEIRHWSFPAPHGIGELMGRLNHIRAEHEALQYNDSLVFHATDSDQLIAYSKTRGDNIILTVVNLDPHHVQRGWVTLDLEAWGISPTDTYQLHELLTDARYLWTGARNYVELSPIFIPAHVFRLRKFVRTEHDFDYYM